MLSRHANSFFLLLPFKWLNTFHPFCMKFVLLFFMFESAYCFVYYNTFLCRMHKRVINLITLLAHLGNYLILIVIVAFFPLPSVAIAVIFTDFFLPAFSALTFPDPDTVAYFVLLLVHFSFLLAPLDAVTLAFRLSVFPALTVFFPVILYLLNGSFHDLDFERCFLSTYFFPWNLSLLHK